MIYHAEGEKNNLKRESLWIKPYKNISREKIKKKISEVINISRKHTHWFI